jgi:hypothetical protein
MAEDWLIALRIRVVDCACIADCLQDLCDTCMSSASSSRVLHDQYHAGLLSAYLVWVCFEKQEITADSIAGACRYFITGYVLNMLLQRPQPHTVRLINALGTLTLDINIIRL